MDYGLKDRDAADSLLALALETQLTSSQPEELLMPSPPSMRPQPDDETSPEPGRLRLPSPPPTNSTKEKSQPIYSDSDTSSSISSGPSSPVPAPVINPTKDQSRPIDSVSDTTSSLSSAPSSPNLSPTPTLSPLSPSEQTDLISRIHAGLSYTRTQQSRNLPITQTTRFTLCPQSATHRLALHLLRKNATLISSSPTHECYELGIPRPDFVREGAVAGVHDAQWWMGKSKAEIKAGPWADEAEVRVAEGRIRGVETRRRKRGVGKGEKEKEWKLREGVRRAEEEEGSDEDEEMEDIKEGDGSEEDGEEVEEMEAVEENEGEAMEGVEHEISAPATPSSTKLRSQAGFSASPSTMRLRSQGAVESSPSSPSSRVLRSHKK